MWSRCRWVRTTRSISSGSTPAAASSCGSRPGVPIQVAPGAPGPPTPVSTSTTRSRPRTTKHQSRSRQRPGPPNTSGWRRRHGSQAAASTWGKARSRGAGKSPVTSHTAVTWTVPTVRVRLVIGDRHLLVEHHVMAHAGEVSATVR
jgi:hypothetical protein